MFIVGRLQSKIHWHDLFITGKKLQRERAPWERDHTSDDTGRDFDENTFLGRSISLTENGHSDGMYRIGWNSVSTKLRRI